jgi:hypothetical protein
LNSEVALDTVDVTAATALPITDLRAVLGCDFAGFECTEALRAAPAGMLRLPNPAFAFGALLSTSLLWAAAALVPVFAFDLGAGFLAIRVFLKMNSTFATATRRLRFPFRPAYSRRFKHRLQRYVTLSPKPVPLAAVIG